MKKSRKVSMTILIIILATLIGALAYVLHRRYLPNNEIVKFEDLLPGAKINENETYIFVGKEYLDKDRGYKKDGDFYLPLSIANKIDSRFYYEQSDKKLLYTNSKNTMKISINETKANIGDEVVDLGYIALIEENNIVYVNTKFIDSRTKVMIKWYENPNRIIVFNDFSLKTGNISDNSPIRTLTGFKSPLVKKSKQEQVFKLKEFEEWTKIVTLDGYIGYTKTDNLSKLVNYNGKEIEEEPYQYFTLDKKIVMGWHQVTNDFANMVVESLPEVSKGLNVISPTWLEISDMNANIKSLADLAYVSKMSAMNIDVWILINDFNKDININKLLAKENLRQKLINNIIKEVKGTGATGINIDFEKITEEGASSYIQFLRELYIVTRKEGIVVSVDNYVPKNYNKFYLREAQAQVVDYVVIMGYDEHTGVDVGPVSSYDFTKEGIEETLKEVPKNKVINGVPFYTKLWKINSQGQGNTQPNIKAEDIGINQQEKIIKKYKGETTFDKDAKLDYFEAKENITTYKMWIENKKSMQDKIDLIKKYDLAGVACWKLGLETNDVWDVVRQIGKK